MDICISKNKVPIRLSSERWLHISVGQPDIVPFYYEILETIEKPLVVYEGEAGELIAVSTEVVNIDKRIIVVYKELNVKDGFIITAFISNKLNYLKKRKILWEHQN